MGSKNQQIPSLRKNRNPMQFRDKLRPGRESAAISADGSMEISTDVLVVGTACVANVRKWIQLRTRIRRATAGRNLIFSKMKTM
jgi:hypothetical protein